VLAGFIRVLSPTLEKQWSRKGCRGFGHDILSLTNNTLGFCETGDWRLEIIGLQSLILNLQKSRLIYEYAVRVIEGRVGLRVG
jgi:hypothetical protein